MGRAEDLSEAGLVLRDPVCRGEGSRCFVQAFAWDVFFADDDDHASEETLEDIEDIANGSVVAEGGKCRSVKDHLPLDSPLGGKEGSCVYWDFDAHGRGARQAVLGFERTGAFDGEEHAGVDGGNVVPTVFPDQVGLEPKQPLMGTGVGGTESVCGGERDAGPGSPVVHSLYAAGKRDDGEGGVGHSVWRRGEREGEGEVRVKGGVLKGWEGSAIVVTRFPSPGSVSKRGKLGNIVVTKKKKDGQGGNIPRLILFRQRTTLSLCLNLRDARSEERNRNWFP